MHLIYLGIIAAISASAAAHSPRDESPLPVCEEPGWFCPSPGTTGFCNKHNRYVDGSVCTVDTSCTILANGTAACTEQACSGYPPESQEARLHRRDGLSGGEDQSDLGTETIDHDDPTPDPLDPPPRQCDATGWFCPTRIKRAFCSHLGQITRTVGCDRGQCCGVSLKGEVGCSLEACRRYQRIENAKGPEVDEGVGGDDDEEEEEEPLDYCQQRRKPGWSCHSERVAVLCNGDHEEADGFGCDEGWCCTMSEFGKASCTQEECYMQPFVTLREDSEAEPLPTKGPWDGILRRSWSGNSSELMTASPARPTKRGAGDDRLFSMLNSTSAAARIHSALVVGYNGTDGLNISSAIGNTTRNSSSYPPFFQHEVDDDCIIGEVRCYHHNHASPPERQGDAKSHIEVCNGSHRWMAVEVCEEPEERCEMVAENNAKCIEVHW